VSNTHNESTLLVVYQLVDYQFIGLSQKKGGDITDIYFIEVK